MSYGVLKGVAMRTDSDCVQVEKGKKEMYNMNHEKDGGGA
jgi:hypothetical protein